MSAVPAGRGGATVLALVAGLALATGGCRITSDSEPKAVATSGRPQEVANGALLAAVDGVGGRGRGWQTVLGQPLARLPEDPDGWAALRFTNDGSAAVYPDSRDRLAVWDLETGSKKVLVPCRRSCSGSSVSPDLSTVAYFTSAGLQLRSVATGQVSHVPLTIPLPGRPDWSPDGQRLAFASTGGLYTIAADGSDLREIYTRTEATDMWTTVSWSPDSSRIAFFDTALMAPGTRQEQTVFTAMTVSADGTDPVTLHDAGFCYCLGLSPPSLTWSPDGSLLAVATTKLTSGTGIYTVRPDGSDWTLVQGGYFGQPAWQPVIE